MKNLYSNYVDDDLWLIKETEWVKSLQNVRESQLTLGNGYLGSRAVLDEIPFNAMPGTYISGVYDKMISQVPELVNLPNPFNFSFTSKGEKIGLITMDSLKHKRVLNLKKGLLVRNTLYQNTKKKRFNYQSIRFVSMDNKNIGVMQIAITPLDDNCELDISTGIDTSVHNAGMLTEGRKKHFRVMDLGQHKNAGYLLLETLEKQHTIIYWAGFYYEVNGKKNYAKDNIFRLKLRKNHTLILTKIFYVKRFVPNGNLTALKNDSFKEFNKAFRAKFDLLINKHIQAWDVLWKKADITIEGTANLQQNLRFNLYHLLICSHFDDGFSSIGARTLSGEGYRGHIFWDTEIFILPFFIFNFPEFAKNMLLYRYQRLDKAREIAKQNGYKGAQFPWESADTGVETTPGWAKDLDGTIIKIHTHQMEHHITANISYAIYKYYVVTGDERFMHDYGLEMIFEAARFWASRVKFNKNRNKYEIRKVIGPDEFHIGVNNNAYTNMMAKWNLITASKLFNQLKNKHPIILKQLQKKLDLKQRETAEWKRIASLISINITKDRIVEQFDGYFKLKKIIPRETDENGIPIISRKLKTVDLNKTQLVKQADVVMLLYLLSDVFSFQTKKQSYEFYAKRTLHKSSLSPSMHALMACKTHNLYEAYHFFNVALRTDISNLFGNTKEGIHGACLGGTWQTVIFGFAGIDIRKERLCINPVIPRSWKKIIFSLLWKGDIIKLELTNDTIIIRATSRRKKLIEIAVFDKIINIRSNKAYLFKRKKPILAADYHY